MKLLELQLGDVEEWNSILKQVKFIRYLHPKKDILIGGSTKLSIFKVLSKITMCKIKCIIFKFYFNVLKNEIPNNAPDIGRKNEQKVYYSFDRFFQAYNAMKMYGWSEALQLL